MSNQLESVQRGFLNGIWAAVPTPFTEHLELDVVGLGKNTARFAELGLDGIFCNGLVGELWCLSLAERQAALEAILEACPKELDIGVVVSAPSLEDTIDLARHAETGGVHHIVLLHPPGFRCEDEVERYVFEVAEKVTTPIVLFDGGGHLQFSPKVISTLAAEGVISGIKCTRGNDAADSTRAITPDFFSVADPYESHWLTSLLRFPDAPLYADPEPYLFQMPNQTLIADYYSAMREDDYGRACSLYKQLEPIRALYQQYIMLPLQQGLSISQYVKRWMSHLGYATGPVRLPQQNKREAEMVAFDKQILTAFQQAYGEDFDFTQARAQWRF